MTNQEIDSLALWNDVFALGEQLRDLWDLELKKLDNPEIKKRMDEIGQSWRFIYETLRDG